MYSGKERMISPEEDPQMVQDLIEKYLPYYVSPTQIIYILHKKHKIEPALTKVVWQKLEEQNQEFFKEYQLRWLLKTQIIKFNDLLHRQAEHMGQVGPRGPASRPKSHMPTMHQNTQSYAPKNTSDGPGPFTTCGPPVDIPSNMPLAQNLNLGLNGPAVETKPGCSYNPTLVFGPNGNAVDVGPTIGGAPVYYFSWNDSYSHELNGIFFDDPPPDFKDDVVDNS